MSTTLAGIDEATRAALATLIDVADLAMPFAIRTFSELGIADHLRDGPRATPELAGRLAVEAQPLRRLLAALSAGKLLAQPELDVFALTPATELLCTDHPVSLRDAYRLSRLEARTWGHFSYCLRTGAAAFERVYGQPHRRYRAEHPEEDARMDDAHRAASRVQALTLVRVYPWRRVRAVVDVGGGTGAFLTGLLRRYPHMTGTLFELAQMAGWARDLMADSDVADRCEVVSGDFFISVPPGADVYVLKSVLGGWDDEAGTRILRSVRSAMRADSTVLVIEPMMGYGDQFSMSNVVHLQSLLLYGGIDRTRADYEALFARAGLWIKQVITWAALPVLELVPDRPEGQWGSPA